MKKEDHIDQVNHPGLGTTLTGILVSAVLAVIKASAGILGNSYALIADAIESTADVFTSAMLWFGIKWSTRPADEDHPYGHGKAEAMVSIGIAAALCIAAFIIAKESINNITTPHASPSAFTLVVLVVVIVTKELLFRYILKKGLEINSGAVKADAFHHRSDAITSAAAFIGITIGLVGGKGYEVADDWAALFAAAIIVVNAYLIFRPAMGELLDEALSPELDQQVREVAARTPGVVLVQKCHCRKMGLLVHADLHIWVDAQLSVKAGHDIAHHVKADIRSQLPQFADVMIHIEPAALA